MADLSEAALNAVVLTNGWDPKPLRRADFQMDYPVERLPGVIGQAVQEVADYVQAPVALVAGCALSAVAASVQTQFSVSRNTVLHGPASLYFLTIAESGERKSTADGFFMKPIREWEAHQRQQQKQADALYQSELEAWEAGGRDGDKPEQPAPTAKMLRGDDTSEALVAHLAKYPIAAVISAEAGVIFGSHWRCCTNRSLGGFNRGIRGDSWSG